MCTKVMMITMTPIFFSAHHFGHSDMVGPSLVIRHHCKLKSCIFGAFCREDGQPFCGQRLEAICVRSGWRWGGTIQGCSQNTLNDSSELLHTLVMLCLIKDCDSWCKIASPWLQSSIKQLMKSWGLVLHDFEICCEKSWFCESLHLMCSKSNPKTQFSQPPDTTVEFSLLKTLQILKMPEKGCHQFSDGLELLKRSQLDNKLWSCGMWMCIEYV